MTGKLPWAALAGLLAAGAAHAIGLDPAQPDHPISPSAGTFTVQPPPGWVCGSSKTQVGCSRDGFMLNAVTVDLRPHKKAFPTLKKSSSADALPEDLAETLAAERSATPSLRDVKLLAVEPAELAGHPAFRAHFTYRLSDESGGALYDAVVVGAALTAGLLLAQYEAPRLNYFGKSLPAFDAMLPTIALANGVPRRGPERETIN
jgi:hypothetical protein